MIDARIEHAVIAYEEACHASTHALCEGAMTCQEGLRALGEIWHSQQLSMAFDANRDAVARRGEMPGHDWPTPTLMRVVHDAILAQPTIRGHHRATVITMGLARLAERGVPADCIVRSCAGPALLRRIIVTVSGVWAATKNGAIDHREVPELEDWFRLLEGCPGISSLENPDVVLVSTRALSGSVRQAAEDWLATASITHIIGWRIEGCLHVTPEDDDLTLPCGSSGTRWVYDRFTKTYLSDWNPESLDWEAAFISHPSEVAAAVGIRQTMLNERRVAEEALAKARLNVLLGTSSSVMVDGMTVSEVFETVLSLLESGNLTAARDFARRAFQARPGVEALRLAYGFCLVPVQPNEAESILQPLPEDGSYCTVLRLNRAAIALMREDVSAARSLAERSLDADDEPPAWLWDPVSLPRAPQVIYCTPREWLERLTS